MKEKTILFGNVNPQKTNLLKLIETDTSDGSFGLLDSTINEINEQLAVSSFDEFAEKFPLGTERNLYAPLAKLIDDKKRKKYVMTDAADIFDKMLPVSKGHVQRLVRCRNHLIHQIQKQDLNADSIADLYSGLQETLSSGYDTCVLTACIIEDICNGLGRMEEKNIDRALAADIPNVPVRIVDRALQTGTLVYHLEQNAQERYLKLLGALEQEYGGSSGSMEHVMTWLAIPAYLSGKNTKKLMTAYGKYSSLYHQNYREYWFGARPVVETLLGIKLFFDKAAEENETRQLLIANVSLRDMEHAENQRKLDVYLQTTNTKLYDCDAVKKALVPELAYRDFHITKEKKVRKRFQSSDKNGQLRTCETGSAQQAKTLTDALEKNIFGKYRIPVRCSDAGTPKMPVLVGDDAVYTPCPMLAYDAMNQRLRIIPGRQIWFDGIGIERIYTEEYGEYGYGRKELF